MMKISNKKYQNLQDRKFGKDFLIIVTRVELQLEWGEVEAFMKEADTQNFQSIDLEEDYSSGDRALVISGLTTYRDTRGTSDDRGKAPA
ncbi:unnamed protein product [Lactuca saligna]|uniref:Uncharacterized protein n=1 Tax=Lactuca saligna TaxID=75948 RepID=A0AA36A4H9_LACSI|nr:unnamed protein product [Lactuca saligna]